MRTAPNDGINRPECSECVTQTSMSCERCGVPICGGCAPFHACDWNDLLRVQGLSEEED